jgi:protein subunit release factor A
VPDTEKSGRRHSSFVTIALVADESKGIADLDGTIESYSRGSGAGGQHRNKTDSAVTLRHPSGITVHCEQERSQWQNRQRAWAELEKRLLGIQDSILSSEVNSIRMAQLADRGWTWTAWRDEVVDRSTGKKARFSDLLKGKSWHKMTA